MSRKVGRDERVDVCRASASRDDRISEKTWELDLPREQPVRHGIRRRRPGLYPRARARSRLIPASDDRASRARARRVTRRILPPTAARPPRPRNPLAFSRSETAPPDVRVAPDGAEHVTRMPNLWLRSGPSASCFEHPPALFRSCSESLGNSPSRTARAGRRTLDQRSVGPAPACLYAPVRCLTSDAFHGRTPDASQVFEPLSIAPESRGNRSSGSRWRAP